MGNRVLTCWPCGEGGNHTNCYSDGICRCECPYNKKVKEAKLKVQIAKEAQT